MKFPFRLHFAGYPLDPLAQISVPARAPPVASPGITQDPVEVLQELMGLRQIVRVEISLFLTLRDHGPDLIARSATSKQHLHDKRPARDLCSEDQAPAARRLPRAIRIP